MGVQGSGRRCGYAHPQNVAIVHPDQSKAVSNSNHSKKKATPGPKADRLKLKGNWKDLVKKSLSKNKPVEGWPK
jgi:hypothetical protein